MYSKCSKIKKRLVHDDMRDGRLKSICKKMSPKYAHNTTVDIISNILKGRKIFILFSLLSTICERAVCDNGNSLVKSDI